MEHTTMAEKIEQPTEEKKPAKPAKADSKKPAKKAKQQKQDDGMYLPVLVEFTFTSSVIILILMFLVITVVSWRTGASLLDFVLRTGIAMGVLGGLLMVVSRQVSTGVLNANLAEIEEKLQESASEELQNPGQLESFENAENFENSERIEIPAMAEAQ
jgi:hypothetical protein